MIGNQPKYTLEKLQKDQRLLESIKANLPELESLLFVFQSDYEDRVYASITSHSKFIYFRTPPRPP
ncbi:MAG TPA: hypothetical protein DC054_25875 [Blastocatellia bacterium]|nr:hypothetical protein [Blastocatellia bacterium]